MKPTSAIAPHLQTIRGSDRIFRLAESAFAYPTVLEDTHEYPSIHRRVRAC